MTDKLVEKPYGAFRCKGDIVVVIEQADEVAMNDVGKERGDPPRIQLEAWIEDYKIISVGSRRMGWVS